jgi:hypothetical protein
MQESTEKSGALFRQIPVIISEVRLDFSDLMRTNESIAAVILGSDTDIFTKAGILERLLPSLPMAGDCACACSCSCSCMCS